MQRVRGLDTACCMVALAAAIAVVPEATARRWDTQNILVIVRMDDRLAERQLMVIVHRLDALSPHAWKLAGHRPEPPVMTKKAVGDPVG